MLIPDPVGSTVRYEAMKLCTGSVGGAQSSRSNLVPRTQILGPFGPPKKHVNFDLCNDRNGYFVTVSI